MFTTLLITLTVLCAGDVKKVHGAKVGGVSLLVWPATESVQGKMVLRVTIKNDEDNPILVPKFKLMDGKRTFVPERESGNVWGDDDVINPGGGTDVELHFSLYAKGQYKLIFTLDDGRTGEVAVGQ